MRRALAPVAILCGLLSVSAWAQKAPPIPVPADNPTKADGAPPQDGEAGGRNRGAGRPAPEQVVPEIVSQLDPTGQAGATPGGVRSTGPRTSAIFFWLFAVMAVGGAIATITRKNPVTAVMFLVGTFLALSALYAMLYAHFIAVIQVLVYAGAIMVLFVFVVMIMNKEEEEPWTTRTAWGWAGKGIAGLTLVYLVVRLITVLWTAPSPQVDVVMSEGFGSTRSMGQVLFSSYLFPFEAVSLVLLVAVVGAVVLAHPEHTTAQQAERREDPDWAGPPPKDGEVAKS